MKIITWNVAGYRAAVKKGFWDKIAIINPDIICLQEIKCLQSDIESSLFGFNYEFVSFSATSRKGYSGVAIFWKKELKVLGHFVGLDEPKFDEEGRIVALKFEFNNQKICLINGYYPQGGREGRVPYKIEFYDKVLEIVNNLEDFIPILTGDLNTTICDLDLARPKQNRKTTGCLPNEREAFGRLLKADFELNQNNELVIANSELIDAFRQFYPQMTGCYTYWDQITRARDRNVGWRIDYFLVSKKIPLASCEILANVIGSDHCPVELVI
jgi:exodeoxyribonuclease-3